MLLQLSDKGPEPNCPVQVCQAATGAWRCPSLSRGRRQLCWAAHACQHWGRPAQLHLQEDKGACKAACTAITGDILEEALEKVQKSFIWV